MFGLQAPLAQHLQFVDCQARRVIDMVGVGREIVERVGRLELVNA